jgi:hypothetical protein
MNKITFPLNPRMQGPNVGDLQTALQLLLDKAIILPNDPSARRALSAGLAREHTEQTYGDSTREAVSVFQDERHLEVSGTVDEATAIALNRLLDELSAPGDEQRAYTVKGTVRFADSAPAAGIMVSAVDRDLRSEQVLGQSQTDREGFYEIHYSTRQFQVKGARLDYFCGDVEFKLEWVGRHNADKSRALVNVWGDANDFRSMSAFLVANEWRNTCLREPTYST